MTELHASPAPGTLPSGTPAPAVVAPRGDGLLVALGALACYLLLRQGVLYAYDAVKIMDWMRNDVIDIHVHFFYLPLLAGFEWLLTPLDLSSFAVAGIFSAVGAAIGVALTHTACRTLGMPRGAALWATAVTAACPPILFFATLVEKHTPGFAFDGLAFLATARFAVRATPGRAVSLGAAMGLAFTVHSYGALLPAILLPVVVALRFQWGLLRDRDAWLRLIALGTLAVVVETVVMFGTPLLIQACGGAASSGEISRFLYKILPQIRSVTDVLVHGFWTEWLYPFFPLSLVCVWGFCRRDTLPMALALLCGFVPYFVLAALMLGAFEEVDLEDWGAYLIPLTWPMAMLIGAALPRRALGIVLVTTLAWGVYLVRDHDHPERNSEFAAGVEQLAEGERFLLLVGGYRDTEAAIVGWRDQTYVLLGDWMAQPAVLAGMDQTIARHWKLGNRVYMTAMAEEYLAKASVEHPQFPGARLLEHLQSRYRIKRVTARGFEGVQILPLQ